MKYLGLIAIMAWVIWGLFWVIFNWPILEKEEPSIWEEYSYTYKDDKIISESLSGVRVIFDKKMMWHVSCKNDEVLLEH